MTVDQQTGPHSPAQEPDGQSGVEFLSERAEELFDQGVINRREATFSPVAAQVELQLESPVSEPAPSAQPDQPPAPEQQKSRVQPKHGRRGLPHTDDNARGAHGEVVPSELR